MESILLIPLKPDVWDSKKYRDVLMKILSYPNYNEDIAGERFRSLIDTGLKGLLIEGEMKIGDISFIGKGTNSLVIKGLFKDNVVIIKILRLDASRDSLIHEAEILTDLEETGIAPKIIASSNWFIIEEFIDGVLIRDFLQKDIYSYRKSEIDLLIRDILTKSHELDQLGIDHGELNRADKHVIITDKLKSKIIDFESASKLRRPKNLTSISHYLFVRSYSAEYLRILYDINLNNLNNILKRYKTDFSAENFMEYMKYLNIQP